MTRAVIHREAIPPGVRYACCIAGPANRHGTPPRGGRRRRDAALPPDVAGFSRRPPPAGASVAPPPCGSAAMAVARCTNFLYQAKDDSFLPLPTGLVRAGPSALRRQADH